MSQSVGHQFCVFAPVKCPMVVIMLLVFPLKCWMFLGLTNLVLDIYLFTDRVSVDLAGPQLTDSLAPASCSGSMKVSTAVTGFWMVVSAIAQTWPSECRESVYKGWPLESKLGLHLALGLQSFIL